LFNTVIFTHIGEDSIIGKIVSIIKSGFTIINVDFPIINSSFDNKVDRSASLSVILWGIQLQIQLMIAFRGCFVTILYKNALILIQKT
jgi:hypothetical protein